MPAIPQPAIHLKLNDNAANDTVVNAGYSEVSCTLSNNNGGSPAAENTSVVSETGKISSAFHLDGTNHYVEFDSFSLATEVGHYSSGSLAIWIKFDTLAAQQVIFSQGSSALSPNADANTLSVNTLGQLRFRGENNSVKLDEYTADGVIVTGTWYHIVLVQDGKKARFYVNSVFTPSETDVVTQTISSIWLTSFGSSDNKFRLGCRSYGASTPNNGNDQFMDGFIDDFRLYDRVLTQTEINALYNSGNGTETTIVTYAAAFSSCGTGKMPFLHAKFNDNAASTTVLHSGSSSFDMSSSVNTSILTTTGKVGSCFAFNGTSEYAFLDGSPINGLSFDETGSFAFWFNADALAGKVMTGFGVFGAPVEELIITSNTFGIEIRAFDSGTEYFDCKTQAFPLSTGVWYHCAVVQNAEEIRVWMNGVEQALYFESTPGNNRGFWLSDLSGMASGAAGLRIGCINSEGAGNQFFFDGKIDDFRYYREVLTQADIDLIYNSGNGTETTVVSPSIVTGTPAIHVKCEDNASSHIITNDGYFTENGFVNATKLLLHFNVSPYVDDSGYNQGIIPDTITLDTTTKKFGAASASFDGFTSNFRLSVLTGEIDGHYNVTASTTEDWTIDLWAKHVDHVGTEVYASLYLDLNNEWRIEHIDGTGIRFHVTSAGATIIDCVESVTTLSEISDTSWHHVAMCKVGDEYGMYLDGTQVCYVLDTSTKFFSSPQLHIGRRGNSSLFFEGNMDDFRITQKNIFSAAPNGLGTNGNGTDTITIPVAEATSYGTDQLTTTGKIGNGFDLNGTDEFINLSKLVGAIKYDRVGSICMWFNPDVMSGSQTLFSISNYNAGGYWVATYENSGAINLRCHTGSSLLMSYATVSTFATGTWHFLSVVNDGRKIRIYVDGKLEADAAGTTQDPSIWFSSVAFGTDTVSLGARFISAVGADTKFNGQIDDFRYYQYPLTQDEVHFLYAGGSGTEGIPTVNTTSYVSTQGSNTDDTHIDSANATTNYDATTIQVGLGAVSDTERGLIKFTDFAASIPSAAIIISATIFLTQVSSGADDGSLSKDIVSVYEVLQNWVENQATWNNYSTGNAWGTAGCGLAGTDFVNTIIGSSGPTLENILAPYTIEVPLNKTGVQLIQDIVDGTEPNNYGFLLKQDDEVTASAQAAFYDEVLASGVPPYLSITYKIIQRNQAVIIT